MRTNCTVTSEDPIFGMCLNYDNSFVLLLCMSIFAPGFITGCVQSVAADCKRFLPTHSLLQWLGLVYCKRHSKIYTRNLLTIRRIHQDLQQDSVYLIVHINFSHSRISIEIVRTKLVSLLLGFLKPISVFNDFRIFTREILMVAVQCRYYQVIT